MMRCAFLWLASMAAASAQIRFIDGTTFAMGESLAAVERRVNDRSFPTEPGNDPDLQTVATNPARFLFDSGKMWRVMLTDLKVVAQPIAPFAESWRNFAPLNDRRMSSRMPRASFDAYLEDWKQHAEAAGKKEGVDYWVKLSGSERSGRDVTIVFGPRRRLVGTGKLTGDMWVAEFFAEEGTLPPNIEPGSLRGIIATCDEFSTKNRGEPGKGEDKAMPPPPDLSKGGIVLEDGTHLHFGLKQADAEQRVGKAATASGNSSQARIRFERDSVGFFGERLAVISYDVFPRSPEPFPEAWKNFSTIGQRSVAPGMTPEEFDLYLEAWEARAAAQGMVKGRHIARADSKGSLGPVVTIALQPTVAGKPPDSWRVSFMMSGNPPNRGLTIQSVLAMRGEYLPGRAAGVPRLESEAPAAAPVRPPPPLPMPEITLPKL